MARARLVASFASIVPFAVASALGIGCTFGGLANYTIDTCDPSMKTQAADVCDRLNKGDPSTCMPYQCDVASRHCIQKTRDDDRDGDPSPTCGGTDCDETDPRRSGKAAETCDGVDNNCDGIVDEDVLTPGAEARISSPGALSSDADPALSSADQTAFLGTYVLSTGQGACIPLVAMQPGSGTVAPSGCSILGDELGLVPHQPRALSLSAGSGAAFVATSTCPGGRLAYRYHGASSAGFDLACDAAHPAALPTVSAMPESANANSGVVTWLEAGLTDRLDAVGGCATVKPAPLAVVYVQSLIAPDPVSASAVIRSSDTSAATRPPALVPIDAAHGILMAAPYAADVGVWLLTPAVLQGGALPVPTRVPALAGAHEVALAAHINDDKSIAVALVAEIGCHPAASVQAVLGTLDPASGVFSVSSSLPAAPAADVATQPSVAWVTARGEWWVGWIDSGPHEHVLRVSAQGKAIGGAIDMGKQFLVGAISTAGSAFGFDPGDSAGSFVEIPIGCSP